MPSDRSLQECRQRKGGVPDMARSAVRINSQRFRDNFYALAAVGATPEGGVHRPALSGAHQAARRWFLDTARQAGLETKVDGAGNHSALLRCASSRAPTLLLGSHLDSVPDGGRFDGALGVVAALEVLQTVRDHNLPVVTQLEAIDFTDEEGYYVSLLGSLALCGMLRPGHVQNARGGQARFHDALAGAGLTEGGLLRASRQPATLACYLELHVEQGSRLHDKGTQIGVVTSIVGIRSLNLRFLGRADHAGTTEMSKRRDAGWGASAFSLAVRRVLIDDFPACVATIGWELFDPGVCNVVPGRATVSLEFRAADDDQLDELESRLCNEARSSAERFELELEILHIDRATPVQMDAQVQRAITEACQGLGLSHALLPSRAGHDAQSLATVCPTGMIFVPSAGGYSHSTREHTDWEDCVNGANVLLQTALCLAQA